MATGTMLNNLGQGVLQYSKTYNRLSMCYMSNFSFLCPLSNLQRISYPNIKFGFSIRRFKKNHTSIFLTPLSLVALLTKAKWKPHETVFIIIIWAVHTLS